MNERWKCKNIKLEKYSSQKVESNSIRNIFDEWLKILPTFPIALYQNIHLVTEISH